MRQSFDRIRSITSSLSFAACLVLLGTTLSISCSSKEPPPRSERIDRSNLTIDVAPIMRGTVASEATVIGFDPVVVRGYGLVVGLNGTGARDIPPNLRAHMLAEMARHGIGSEQTGYGHLTPEAMLDSPDTAVVIVEGVIPSGALGRRYLPRRWGEPKEVIPGTSFDVRVYADPRTGTTSLEGGRLYTTPLRPGALSTGSRQARALAEARGPIFVNPFTDPEDPTGTAMVNAGRILNGGEVVEDMPVKLRLYNPSHTRASVLQATINAKYPIEPGQLKKTAHGESDEQIEINVPPSFKGNTAEFIQLVRHTTIRLAGAEATANAVKRALLLNPTDAATAAWRWQALGVRVLPIIRDLYDTPEELPRLAALQAGAKLNDAMVSRHLLDMARIASPTTRVEAINLLAAMGPNPAIDLGLRELLDDADVAVRLAAYEALVERGDYSILRIPVDETFVIDVVESSHPMVYIAQIGVPRIVIFDPGLSLERPLTVSAWDGRLMVKGDPDDDDVEVYYRPGEYDERGIIQKAGANLVEFLYFLGHRTTVEQPEPGLGLTYGKTVGVIHQIWSQDYLRADFKAEQDRVQAAIMAQEQQSDTQARPEFNDEDSGETDPLEGTGGVEVDRNTNWLRPDQGDASPDDEVETGP
jgi:hypothetical protein